MDETVYFCNIVQKIDNENPTLLVRNLTHTDNMVMWGHWLMCDTSFIQYTIYI
jgi:hypothetical protein